MNIVVGLGNPGARYEQTRHNVGFMVLNNLRQVFECQNYTSNKRIHSDVCRVEKIIFVRPQTFMNESGVAVRSVLDFYKLTPQATKTGGYHNLFVIHDDLDLELGSYKIQYGVGPKGHNGLLSIYQHLGTQNFWHIRFGIDTRRGERTIPPQAYVLERFSPQELEKVNQVMFELVRELTQKI